MQVPGEGQIASSGMMNLWFPGCHDHSWFQDSWNLAWTQGRLALVRVCHWEKLSHKEETWRDTLETGSQEQEGTEVRAGSFPELASR